LLFGFLISAIILNANPAIFTPHATKRIVKSNPKLKILKKKIAIETIKSERAAIQ
jgi:hypothetical protein